MHPSNKKSSFQSQSSAEKIVDAFMAFVLCLLVVATLYPFIYSLFASLSDGALLTRHRGLLFHPLGFSLDAYDKVFKNPMIISGYKNTLLYLVAGTAINMLLTCLGAYVLSRKSFKPRNAIMLFIIFTMFFNGGLIPTFLIVKNIGLYNNFFAMVLPNAISTMNLIILRTSMQEIPDSLEEAARIDGANDFTILFQVIIPVSQAVLAVMVLFYAVGHWNSWFNAMIYLRQRAKFPIQLILREVLLSNSTDSMTTGLPTEGSAVIGEGIKHSTMIVATVPVLIIYPMLQKYFVKGVMIGSIKG
ncbi:MAG: carbohydrate ABC transporter permease [Clostridiales bacterium]|jgi:putative aldouronate transport system permease protein|nr:carbohydrate ABC transporter permease [Clostridiales bacterium]